MWKVLFPGDAEGDIPDPCKLIENHGRNQANFKTATYSSSQYGSRNLMDSASWPSDNITVDEVRANIRKTLQVVQPGSRLDLPTADNNSEISSSPFRMPPRANPFIHRGVSNDSAPRSVAVANLPHSSSTISSERRQQDQMQLSSSHHTCSQVAVQNGSNPNSSSISRNPFHSAASRAPTAFPLRRASDASAYSSFPRVSANHQRINETFFTQLDKVLSCVTTTNSSSSKPILAESSSSAKVRLNDDPKGLDQNQVLPEKEPRGSAMRRSSSCEYRSSSMESAKDKLMHKRNSQPPYGEVPSWPHTISSKSSSSVGAILTPCSSTKSSESSAICYTPSASEFNSESEETYLCDNLCSSPLDSSSSTIKTSFTSMQHEAVSPPAHESRSTQHGSNMVRSRPAKFGTRLSRSICDLRSSTTFAPYSAGVSHRKEIECKLSQEGEPGEDESRSDGDEKIGQQRASEDSCVKGMFACPYYARKPLWHFKYKSCSMTGWENVRRVKYVNEFSNLQAIFAD
jgi:hypothetical protein